MSAMDIDTEVSTVLATIRSESENAELINTVFQLEDFYERKLWHQLTEVLDQIYYHFDSTIITPDLKNKFYNLFIRQFQSKLNPIKVVDFLLESYEDNEQTLDTLLTLKTDFITNLKKEHNFKDEEDPEFKKLVDEDEAIIYVKLQIARYYLLLNKLNDAEDILTELSSKFENLNNNLNSKINAAYYLTKSEHCKILSNYNDYYTNGLLYLSSVSNLNAEEKSKLCYELCIAALLGDKIYNYGELISHELVKDIHENEVEFKLVNYLNEGNLLEFNKWLEIAFNKSPFLKEHELFLRQKIIIMALLELISTKSTTNKQLTFKEISEFTGTPLNDVEHLIIKCFSLNLIQGYINQLQELLIITWLQPRILNLNQVKTLYNHLVEWDNKVEELGKTVYENGGTVWAGM
ncbi:conserved hypothetical protein [Candida tropicalis MYA-3404]|uniref:PCI domain-containing protein n=1 Tax=Candida tropicalis (strain ATCC MYA-3404 / T1) TaxID=294747 RepID=C5M5T3_CANTT|nr:conserved hypothetical protein [Candida tropicalis MYA-3404]EER34353.1 conserved hypothetical protein [Candida tropicalis MYA-3404]KAG4408222.1 hypothetical protein JTP64_001528 [Candida tropicalis]